jgi:hypothetical protein
MILVLAIILFIIFLIYSIKPIKSEEYTLEGLKLSWKNKVGIDGVVTKWIVTLKDSSDNVIHTYENSDAGNLKNFTDVTMNIVNKKEFGDKIIGNNTLELYYNEVKPDTKLYTKTVRFTRDDFGMALDTSNIEEIDIPEPPPPPPITEIPHQIAGGADGWCVGDGKAVHQDVPGCGRICSTWEYTGSKNKGSWGLWGGNQNGIDCPAAKLDQVWKLTGGSTSGRPNRELAVGKVSEPQSTFTYELIMNKKNTSLGIHVEYIKLDGVLATKAQTTIHKNPNRNNKPDNMFSIGSGTENYASWNANGHNVGDKIFTIVSDKKVDKMDIVYTRPRYAPGWIIKENGVTKITETSNRGGNTEPRPVVYTYDIKNGKSSPFTIPYQIPRATDGWCGHANSVHQDVPGCGRLCSDVNFVGSKNKNTWGSWDKYPGSVECPAAKLDEVYQFLNGKRSLRVGKYSGAPPDPMKQFTTGEQLYIKGGKDGKYCADEGNTIKCNRGGIGGWEKFRFNKNSDGTYSLKGGKDNKYCADEGNTIKCNRGSIGSWERFKIIKNSDGTYSLKGGKDNKYCADEGNTIKCNRGSIGSWERFKIGKI